MFDLYSFNELSCLNGSEQIVEKIKEVLSFAREKGFTQRKPYFTNFTIKKDMVTASFFLSFSFPLSVFCQGENHAGRE